MLISHEIPKQLFPFHDSISDYPYILGHLLSLDEEYKEYYKRKLSLSKFSVFDNSAFELGKSIDPELLISLAKEYKPSHLILPDTLHDFNKTIRESTNFYNRYKTTLSSYDITPIGVLQGTTFDELIKCFRGYYKIGVRFMAIPFDCIKDSDWHNIRYLFFKELQREPDFDLCQYHFLGLQNISELLLYSEEEKEKIFSIDTSSPIINGWLGNMYGDYGMYTEKSKAKLADSLDIQLSNQQIENIITNVKKFKEYVNR